jgi:hypothetical protein
MCSARVPHDRAPFLPVFRRRIQQQLVAERVLAAEHLVDEALVDDHDLAALGRVARLEPAACTRSTP